MKRIIVILSFIFLVSLAFAQNTPHSMYVEVVLEGGGNPAVGEVTFTAENMSHPGEILTETSASCDYGVSFAGFIQLQMATYETQWADGDIIHIEATSGGATGNGNFAITAAAGFSYYPGGITLTGGSTGVVTGVSDGTTSGEGDQGSDGNCPNVLELMEPGNAGVYFTWTYDDAVISFPYLLTVTVDIASLGYAPYELAYYFGGQWYYSGQLTWVGNDTQVLIDPSKGIGKADQDMVIVFSNAADAPLPVTLDTFLVNQAQNYGEFATISWTVQSETNMSHYNVYRAETEDFNTAMHLRKVDVEEDHTTTFTYSVTDEYEIQYNTTYHYWLEGVDNAGDSEILANGSVTMEENPYVPSAVTKLEGNYPNPFNPETKIKYFVKEGETATLYIYNAKGQLVQTSSLQETSDQGNVFTWDGTSFGSGIYFYKLKTDSYSEVKKMMMLK